MPGERSCNVRLLERSRLLRQPEIEQLDPLLGHENVGWFQIPVSDAFLMRSIESVQNLSGVLNCFVERQRSFERSAFHQLHDQVVRPNIVELADMGMIQLRRWIGPRTRTAQRIAFSQP